MPDERRPVFAAAIMPARDGAASDEHAFTGAAALCGLAASDVVVFRHLFDPGRFHTCQVCRAAVAEVLVREGAVCAAVRRVLCVVDDDACGADGLEMSFDDGSDVGVRVRADWSLTVSGEMWRETGQCSRRHTGMGPDGETLQGVVGQAVVRRDARWNEVGEFQRFDIAFPRAVLHIGQWGGELTVEVETL